jgi:hypothetical protein
MNKQTEIEVDKTIALLIQATNLLQKIVGEKKARRKARRGASKFKGSSKGTPVDISL